MRVMTLGALGQSALGQTREPLPRRSLLLLFIAPVMTIAVLGGFLVLFQRSQRGLRRR